MTAQLPLFGAVARDKGIEQSVKHADAVHQNWSSQAYELFVSFLAVQKGTFKCEDFREWSKNLLVAPPHLRAFGGIAMRAAKAGLIVKVGYTQVTNVKAHRANCSLWKRA